MKKSELKDLIKPIVEECVRDALLTSGLLSSIISEVVGGLTDGRNASHIVERREHSQVQPEPVKPPVNKKKLLDAIGQDAYNGIDVFEGTKPLKSAGKPRQSGSGGYSPFAYDIKGATIDGVLYPCLDPSIFEVKFPLTDIQGKVVTN